MQVCEKEHHHSPQLYATYSSEDVTGLAKKDKKTLEKAGREMAKVYSKHLGLGIEVAEVKALEAHPAACHGSSQERISRPRVC